MKRIFIINWLIVAYLLCLLVTRIIHSKKYPAPDKLLRSGGMIHHPTYGDYPEKVSFKQGMSLMPGQEAIITAEFISKNERKENNGNRR